MVVTKDRAIIGKKMKKKIFEKKNKKLSPDLF
jgi:hypothetical protein